MVVIALLVIRCAVIVIELRVGWLKHYRFVKVTQVVRQSVGRVFIPDTYQNNPIYDTPAAPLGLGRIGLLICYTPIAPPGLCRSGRIPDLRV